LKDYILYPQDRCYRWMAFTLQRGKGQRWPVAARNCPGRVRCESIWATASQQKILLMNGSRRELSTSRRLTVEKLACYTCPAQFL